MLLFFSKYADAYKDQGIDIWGFTVENEPHGNNSSRESMHYSPDEMTNFVKNFLGPQLEKDGKGDLIILGYDQNRADLKNWVDSMYENEESSKYFDGTAVHWYDSTIEYYPDELQYAHNKAPNKYLIQTEACIDSEIPQWEDDDWYFRKEATDWGYDWREDEKKYLHPKYAPFNRYSRDIIGSLNNWVDGWVDWNMVLDTQGGPNWVNNWCVAPIIVDPNKDEIYYTPLYYVMTHFSKYIRPGAQIIDIENNDDNLMVTAALNPDKSSKIKEKMKSFGSSKEFNFGKDIQWDEVGDGVRRQIMAYDDTIMLVNVEFKKGGIGQMHKHYHAQVTQVVSGSFKVTIGDETKVLNGGDAFYIPPNVMHGAICLEDGILIDVFSPIREDFME